MVSMYHNNINDWIPRLAFHQFPSKHLEESHTILLVLRDEVGLWRRKLMSDL